MTRAIKLRRRSILTGTLKKIAFLAMLSAIDFWLLAKTALADIVIGDTPLDQNPNISLGRPLSSSNNAILISRPQYVISWDVQNRSPEWVSWLLSKQTMGNASRTTSFHVDHELDRILREQNLRSVSPAEYRGSCLDRGHQVPSADRTASQQDNEATFFMSNVIPQSAYLNRQTWVSLERFTRRRVLRHSERAIIYTGSIYANDPETIGPGHDIFVPTKNFKIIVLLSDSEMRDKPSNVRFFVVAFPNFTSRGTNPVTDHEQACADSAKTGRLAEDNTRPLWRPYVTSLQKATEESGLIFSFLNSFRELSPKDIDQLLDEDSSFELGPITGQMFVVPLRQIFPWQRPL